MKLNYLAPAQDGRLIGMGRTIKTGRTLGLADARIEDQKGRLLAHGTVTIMVLPHLLRFWRWPDRFKSALAITADVDAITLWDFVRRARHFLRARSR